MAKIDETLQSKKKAFLAAFAEVGTITRAAEIAGIARQTHYDWLNDDPDYPEMFKEADKQACERLEQEARRRAVDGVSEPVFYKGEKCGVVQKYSDTLLIFLLKGAMPDKYKERVQQEVTQHNNSNSPINLSQLSDEELELYEKIMTKITGNGGVDEGQDN